MQRSVYIIKPEAMKHHDVIRERIEKEGLRVEDRAIALLPVRMLDSLYPDLSSDLRAATVFFFGVGPCEMGIVKGPECIDRLGRLAGSAVNPAECEQSTIRWQFGIHEPIRFGNILYYLNGFHRSCDRAEAERDVALFRELRSCHGIKRVM